MKKDVEKDLACRNVLSVELVAAYIRVSSQEQKLHGLSLDAQKMKLSEYAEKHNMKIVEWYMDEGVSGRKLIKNRPELQRMIHDAEDKKFARIIFIKLDRFFRSVAEYHECMKRIDPVVWTATEEEYDLTTANGRMLVNAKLMIAELEADMAGERITIVNEYKVTTGQPLSGTLPFCYKIVKGEDGRKKIVKNPETEDIMEDVLAHFQMHQSIRKAVIYIRAKHNVDISYKTVAKTLHNTMICGEYRGNPNYIEKPYIDRETFDRIQSMIKRNTKDNTVERDYIFGGLIRCPNCGTILRGAAHHNKTKYGTYIYKMYRCQRWRNNKSCDYRYCVNENTIEKLMLANVEMYLAEAKIKSAEIQDSDAFKIPKQNIDEIAAQIDRLNYSWQTGKIRTVEKYEKDYAELIEKWEKAKAEQATTVVKDFSEIEAILHSGWREIYDHLDDAHKRAFWRSFVERIDVDWENKRLKDVSFF